MDVRFHNFKYCATIDNMIMVGTTSVQVFEWGLSANWEPCRSAMGATASFSPQLD